MEFIGVELAGDAELAAPVEKAAAGQCAEEACGGEEGRRAACHALARRRCRPAEWRRSGERRAVESVVAEAARQSMVAESCRGAAVR